MRTLQEKYNGIQEGKFSKDQFIVEARMQHPNLVTRFNGYDDAIQILKNRGMIQEVAKVVSKNFKGLKYEIHFEAPKGYKIVGVGELEKAIGSPKFYETLAQAKERAESDIKDYLGEKETIKEGFKEFSSQEKAKEEKSKEEKLGASKNLKIGDKVKISASAAKNLKLDPEKEYTIKGFKEHGKGSLKSVDVLLGGNDSVNIDHVKKSLKEARLTKNSLTDYRYKPTNEMDKYPYEQILRGLRVELEGLKVIGTPTPEEYKKALAKVLKNLEKDEIFYTNQLAGRKKKEDLHDKMVFADKKNTVDTFNGMKKAELKEGIKNLLKNILAENGEDFERASRAIEFGSPEEEEEEDEFELQFDEPKEDDVNHPEWERQNFEDDKDDMFESVSLKDLLS